METTFPCISSTSASSQQSRESSFFYLPPTQHDKIQVFNKKAAFCVQLFEKLNEPDQEDNLSFPKLTAIQRKELLTNPAKIISELTEKGRVTTADQTLISLIDEILFGSKHQKYLQPVKELTLLRKIKQVFAEAVVSLNNQIANPSQLFTLAREIAFSIYVRYFLYGPQTLQATAPALPGINENDEIKIFKTFAKTVEFCCLLFNKINRREDFYYCIPDKLTENQIQKIEINPNDIINFLTRARPYNPLEAKDSLTNAIELTTSLLGSKEFDSQKSVAMSEIRQKLFSLIEKLKDPKSPHKAQDARRIFEKYRAVCQEICNNFDLLNKTERDILYYMQQSVFKKRLCNETDEGPAKKKRRLIEPIGMGNDSSAHKPLGFIALRLLSRIYCLQTIEKKLTLTAVQVKAINEKEDQYEVIYEPESNFNLCIRLKKACRLVLRTINFKPKYGKHEVIQLIKKNDRIIKTQLNNSNKIIISLVITHLNTFISALETYKANPNDEAWQTLKQVKFVI